MEIKIENCKNIADYLRLCGVHSVDELTSEQILAWARSGKMGIKTKISVDIVEHGIYGQMPDKEKAIKLLRQAIKEQKSFICVYIENESCDGSHMKNETSDGYFVMKIK